MSASAVEVRGVEISSEIGSAFLSNLIITAFGSIQKPVVGKFATSLIHPRPVTFNVVSDVTRAKSQTTLGEEFEDLVVYPHLHPRPSLSAHTAAEQRPALIIDDAAVELNLFIEYLLLNRGNTYISSVSKHALTTAGRARRLREKALRAGADTPCPVVDQRPCEKTHAAGLNPVINPMENSQITRSTRATASPATSTTCGSRRSTVPNCPHPTTRTSGVCQQCAVERMFEDEIGDDAEHTCPTCGEPTARSEGDCYRCRGAADECERCGDTQAQLTRVPVADLDEMLTVCPSCQTYLRMKGRILTAIADGGGRNHAQTMGLARMHLCQAITRSSDGQVLTTIEHLDEASEHLETAGFDEAASVVDDIAEGDVCDSETRYDLRQLAQLIDAWANKLFERFLRDQQLEPEVRP